MANANQIYLLTGLVSAMLMTLAWTVALVHTFAGNQNKWLIYVITMLLLS